MVKRKKTEYLPKELLFSRGLLVGIVFILFLGILFYKMGKGYIQTSSPPLPKNPIWQELQKETTASSPIETSDPLIVTVETFYTYITNQQFDLAYDLLSDRFKNEVDYTEFAKGYITTVKTTLVEAKRTNQKANIIQVIIKASDNIGTKSLLRTFTGEWQLKQERGVWKLDSANIRQVE